MTMMEEKIDDATMSAEEQLQLLLQEAGLESVPMDPASMEALKALVSTPDFYHAPPPITTEATTTSASESDQHRRPVSEVVPRNPELKRFTSELTTASNDFSLFGGDDTSGKAVARSSNATGGFAPLEGASAVENHILEQLHRQTNLMLEMQRRMDDLATTVEFLMANGDGAASPSGGGGGGGATNTTRTPTDPATPGKRRSINTLNPPQTTPAAPVAAGQPQPPVVPAAAAGRPRVAVPNNNNQGGFLHAIRNARLVQIAAAFLQLRRRYGVLPLDGGLIFKVLFMMAILSTRMSGSSPSKRFATKSGVVVDDTHLKFLVMSLLVMVGFLMQTGYLKYSYIFFVKENIAGRIWDGETIEDILRGGNNNNNNNNDPNNNNNANNNNPAGGQGVPPRGQLPPGHPQRGAAADHQGRANNGFVENVAVGGWRNTFLGGIIPQADQGGIVGFFQDIALVLGSFLLSIFPMWQPEAPPPPRNPQPAAGAAAQQQQQEPQPPPGGLAAGPGEVLPPQDAFQAADESDDEDA